MSTRDLFLCCAPVCAHSSICLSVYVCLHVNVLTAHKSVSSFRHRDPEHALLPVSLWLASSLEGAEDSSNNAPLSQRNSLIYTLQVRAKKRAHPQRIVTCTCGRMCTYGCRNKRKTSRYDRFFHGVSLLCHICLWNRQVQGYGHIFSCRLRTVAWHTSIHGRLFVNVPQEWRV